MWHTKNLSFYIDCAFCLVLLPVMIMLLPVERWLTNNSAFVYLLVGWLYAVYLINRKLIVPFFFRSKKHFGWGLCLILFTIVGTYCLTQYHLEMPWRRLPPLQLTQQHFPKVRLQRQGIWFLYLVVTAFSIAIGLLIELHRLIMEKQAIEYEKKKAELALYKAQINPHFLFNSLNTLYGMMITESLQKEAAFMQFVDLMKYMYENNVKDKIPLATEMEYIRQYIGFQQYRMPESVHIHFSYQHDHTDCMDIAPMILITFVENVFKHGISPCRFTDIYIAAQMREGELTFSADNPVLNHQAENASNGIGILNCRKRLELLYPGKYQLFTHVDKERYIVRLIINLQ